MLKDLSEAGKNTGLRINRTESHFISNQWCNEEQLELDGFPITETTSYVYHGRSLNMENNMKEKLDR
ncbi:hypothetical protein KIN20_005566 [Parelaphostrongylus tenuis]|uniref:Uncharacterized protein n=1 Tax=Parelaphostrongylus tenuis TaxID=148309 RepID=A0AAD5MLE4_PARTN|nr:hypothetical protein KIN20_005566 [Parelaphostrongylus tenuis]